MQSAPAGQVGLITTESPPTDDTRVHPMIICDYECAHRARSQVTAQLRALIGEHAEISCYFVGDVRDQDQQVQVLEPGNSWHIDQAMREAQRELDSLNLNSHHTDSIMLASIAQARWKPAWKKITRAVTKASQGAVAVKLRKYDGEAEAQAEARTGGSDDDDDEREELKHERGTKEKLEGVRSTADPEGRGQTQSLSRCEDDP